MAQIIGGAVLAVNFVYENGVVVVVLDGGAVLAECSSLFSSSGANELIMLFSSWSRSRILRQHVGIFAN